MMEISTSAITAAFAAGVISFLSPCVLPLVPGYVSYIAGHAIAGHRSQRMLRPRLYDDFRDFGGQRDSSRPGAHFLPIRAELDRRRDRDRLWSVHARAAAPLV